MDIENVYTDSVHVGVKVCRRYMYGRRYGEEVGGGGYGRR